MLTPLILNLLNSLVSSSVTFIYHFGPKIRYKHTTVQVRG